jgi:hypothetical protein
LKSVKGIVFNVKVASFIFSTSAPVILVSMTLLDDNSMGLKPNKSPTIKLLTNINTTIIFFLTINTTLI